jgi:HEAT repeat protein
MLSARVISLFQIRADESRLVAFVAALFAFVEIGRNIGANAADGLFLIRFGTAYLPHMTVALGALTFIVTLSYTIGLGRFYRGAFFIAVLFAFAALLLIERAALFLDLALLYPILWLTVNTLSAILGTLLWNVAAEVCDARQAKRMFSLFTSAGILGGVLGNLVTGALAKLIGTDNLLVLYAALLLLAAALARGIVRAFFKKDAARGARANWLAELRVGFDFVRASPLMRLIAFSSILFSILYFSVYIPFSRIVSTAYPNDADLAGFLGLFSGTITLLTLVISLFVANRLYARIGVVNAVLLLPITYCVGFALFAVNATFAIAVGIRLAQMVVMNGLAGAAWGAFFNVVPSDKRAQVQSFDGGVTTQIGTMLSGILPILGERVLMPAQIFIAGLVIAFATAYLVWRMRDAYGRALVDALRAGFLDVFTATRRGFQHLSADANAQHALFDGLADAQAARRRLSAEILGKLGDRRAIAPLTRALDDADVEVRCAALAALVQLDARDAMDAIAKRARDAQASVRANALDALSALSSLPRPEFVDALQDADARVRARAAVALHRAGDAARAQSAIAALLESRDAAARAAGLGALAECRASAPVARVAEFLRDESLAVRLAAINALGAFRDCAANEVLVAQLDNSDERVRRAAAIALQTSGVAVETIIRILDAGSERAQDAALVALQGQENVAHKALVDWALTQIPRAAQFRAWAANLARANGAASRSIVFLRDLLREREWQTEQRILQALALIGAGEAVRLISEGLQSQNQEMRAQALEALDTLGDKRIARGLVPLLEASASDAAQDARAVLKDLTQHPDPWLRAFAARALGELLGRDWNALVAQASEDSAMIVREAVAAARRAPPLQIGGEMHETLKTLGTMDRILFLRQVPLFGNLAPEDLQQIAEIAAERVFPANEYLCREGEIGDELFVIVEGQVRVTKRSNGDTRTLRMMNAGEHIGELAIVCEQPRSASVIATGGAVRALAIRGAAMKAILRDRPEVAMAMLASLAQRLSTA